MDTVKSLNPWKAFGCDGISPALINFGPDIMRRYIYKLIYSIEMYNIFPEKLTKSYILSLLKKDPPEEYNNLRPIVLNNSILKIWDKLLNKKQMSFVTEFELLHEAQQAN